MAKLDQSEVSWDIVEMGKHIIWTVRHEGVIGQGIISDETHPHTKTWTIEARKSVALNAVASCVTAFILNPKRAS